MSAGSSSGRSAERTHAHRSDGSIFCRRSTVPLAPPACSRGLPKGRGGDSDRQGTRGRAHHRRLAPGRHGASSGPSTSGIRLPRSMPGRVSCTLPPWSLPPPTLCFRRSRCASLSADSTELRLSERMFGAPAAALPDRLGRPVAVPGSPWGRETIAMASTIGPAARTSAAKASAARPSSRLAWSRMTVQRTPGGESSSAAPSIARSTRASACVAAALQACPFGIAATTLAIARWWFISCRKEFDAAEDMARCSDRLAADPESAYATARISASC
mmetsp:Transcript_4185/g.17677  ORF Transcript_4185/g.17677 Transcript_4185/m.17677 type:complete len:273 (-) Transcript_4185:2061-2879(-)